MSSCVMCTYDVHIFCIYMCHLVCRLTLSLSPCPSSCPSLPLSVLLPQISYEVFGDMKTVELLPGGSGMLVSADNREMYVDLYVEYLLDKSIETQFSAFAKGFHKVCRHMHVIEVSQNDQTRSTITYVVCHIISILTFFF
jgi:hypothetical protein